MKGLSGRVDEIRAYCEAHADPALVRKYSRYFKEGYDAYGVSLPLFEAGRDRFLAEWRDELGLAGFLELGDALVRGSKYELPSFAISFARAFLDEFTPAEFQRMGRWLAGGIGNWAHCDFMSGEVLSPCLLRAIVPMEALAGWRASPSRWQRRAVPVSLIKPFKQTGEIVPALGFVEPLMPDAERVVHQGLGWMLREAWKKQPAPVEAFLLKWKDTAARLIFQYATEKMTPTQKERFRRTPKSPNRK
jgi:3-methyladenine DNA glycosylase AlkD